MNLEKNNCYNHATNQMIGNFCQPGQFRYPQIKFPVDAPADYKYLLKLDGIRECTREYPVNDPEIKIALFTDKFRVDLYHFYKQEKDQNWSHKPGKQSVTNLDASGEIIVDPETCDKNYGNTQNYTNLIGYFVVNSNNIPLSKSPLHNRSLTLVDLGQMIGSAIIGILITGSIMRIFQLKNDSSS